MANPVFIAGAALSAYSALKTAEAEASLLTEQADLLNMSAERVLDLNAENTKQTLQNAKETRGASRTGDAARGFTTDITSLTDITNEAMREIEINTDEAEFQARQFNLEASSKRTGAKNTKSAGRLNAVSSIIGGFR